MWRARTISLTLGSMVLIHLPTAGAPPSEIKPLPLARAHAHNDYYHERPLLDALAHGFCSVEADVYLVDGQLLVGHDRDELRPDRTLESLYLDPLRQRVEMNEGRVFRDGPAFTLLVDIKSEGVATYGALHPLLVRYRAMLTRFDEGGIARGAITVIVSGNRAVEAILARPRRYAGIDGRLSDLTTGTLGPAMPLISDNWRNHFTWRGEGPFSSAERKKLHRLVSEAHGQQKRIRFWATPENEAAWAVLDEAGVDLINTDDLAGLQRFLSARVRSNGGAR